MSDTKKVGYFGIKKSDANTTSGFCYMDKIEDVRSWLVEEKLPLKPETSMNRLTELARKLSL